MRLEATSNEEYLLKLFEKEIEQREERKINLLLKTSNASESKRQSF